MFVRKHRRGLREMQSKTKKKMKLKPHIENEINAERYR